MQRKEKKKKQPHPPKKMEFGLIQILEVGGLHQSMF